MFDTVRFLMLQARVRRMERRLNRIAMKREHCLAHQLAYTAKLEREKDKLRQWTSCMVRPDGVKREADTD